MESPISVTITTHNRLDALRLTLRQIERLSPRPCEILVCVDGCSDGTAEFLLENFPRVRLIKHEQAIGSVASRDELMRAAEGAFVLSLDDDSHPLEPDFLARASQILSTHPGVGVLTFPQRSEEFPDSLEQTGFGRDRLVGSFPNSGALIRRDIYLTLPGYAPFFFHAYEEPDLALQMLAGGHRVVLHTGLTIRHYWTSEGRDEIRTHQRHARNECWSAIMRCPMPWTPFVVLYRMTSQCLYAAKRDIQWLAREPLWWWQFAAGLPSALRNRTPVPWTVYKRWWRLLSKPEPVPEIHSPISEG